MPLIQLIQMLKINLWMQFKVPQVRLRVCSSKPSSGSCKSKSGSSPAGQIPTQGPQFKFQFKVPHRLVKMYQFSHTTTSSSTTSPCWYCSACSQIIYQNWIGKKPEFSGKPEEDAESHLLSTRDWMEAHNFPEGD